MSEEMTLKVFISGSLHTSQTTHSTNCGNVLVYHNMYLREEKQGLDENLMEEARHKLSELTRNRSNVSAPRPTHASERSVSFAIQTVNDLNDFIRDAEKAGFTLDPGPVQLRLEAQEVFSSNNRFLESMGQNPGKGR